MGQCIDMMTVAACHRLVIDQRVQDRFFGGLHRRGEQSVLRLKMSGTHGVLYVHGTLPREREAMVTD